MAGASLIGVPYVGVDGCTRAGEGSSTAMAYEGTSAIAGLDIEPREDDWVNSSFALV